ncbi:MAG: hypothetical protein AB7I35_21635 [Ramlibacter sp.]
MSLRNLARWAFWSLLPWRNLWLVEARDRRHAERGYCRPLLCSCYLDNPRWFGTRAAAVAYAQAQARPILGGASCAVFVVSRWVTPWRPGCTVAELTRGKWQTDWPCLPCVWASETFNTGVGR